MRRFLIASVSLIAFAAPAFAASADDLGYLPPPSPADYQRTLQVVSKMPAFEAQAASLNRSGGIMPAVGTMQQAAPAIRYATNYQVAAIPDYLPMSRMDAQGMQTAQNMYGARNGAFVQPAGFYTQNSAQGTLQGGQSQADVLPANPAPASNNSASSAYASSQALMAAEPLPASPTPAPAYAAPSYAAPSYAAPAPVPAYAAPQAAVPQPMVSQPMMPTPIAPPMAPQPMVMDQAVPVEPVQMAAPVPVMPVAPVVQPQPYYTEPPVVSQPYNPPTMNGNPRYDRIDAPTVRPQSQIISPSPSFAFDPSWRNAGFYAGIRSGLAMPEDTSFDYSGSTYTNEYHTGWNITADVGYQFRPWAYWVAPRAEAEFGRISQSVKTHTVGTAEFEDPNAYGDTSTFVGLANAYLDFKPFNTRLVQPFVGAGLGFGVVDFDRHGITSPIMDDSETGFAWQVGGGLGLDLFNSSTMLDIGYRYLQVAGVDLAARDGTSSSTDVSSHIITFGLRNSF